MKNNIHPLNFSIVQKGLRTIMVFALMLTTMTAFSQDYTLSKVQTGIAQTGTTGVVSITYELTLTNVGVMPFASEAQIFDDVEAAFGAQFEGISQTPQIIASTASSAPIVNNGFDGTATNDTLFITPACLMLPGQFVTVRFSALLDASAVVGDLVNTATAGMKIFPGPGAYVQPQPVATATIDAECWSDCVLACNNQVNISVNTMCEADILAEMLLEGENETCADLGLYVVDIYDQNDNLLSLPLGSQYIGQRLKGVVTNLVCGNTCWSTVLVEDKTPPLLNCDSDTIRCNESISPYNPDIGFPVPVNDITPTADPQRFIASSVDACGAVELVYRDSLVNRDCTDTAFSSLIYRTWRATDASGLTVSCTDTIYFIRGTLADITLPPHYDGVSGNEPALECDGDWCKLPNGLPAPDSCGTGAPIGVFCGNIQYDYNDDTVHVCESSFKVFRTWLIIDWCDPDNRIEYIQRIKVEDNDGPVVIAPPVTPLVLPLDHWDCSRGSYVVPAPVFDPTGQNAVDNPYIPTILEECGSWTYTVEHLTVDENIKDPNECARVDESQIFNTNNVRRLRNGQYELFDIPVGCNWIKYTITDDCGNSTTFTFDIFIEDNIAPIAVCHEHTVVALTSDGKARVLAATFDDGSHDNCGLGLMEVRRMRRGDCPDNVQDSTAFGEYVEFCCEDIAHNPQMVVLRVWDECGENYSECMVEVTIQDKLAPVITDCPQDVRITCEDDYNPLSQFGSASAYDNCNVVISEDAIFNLDACGVGTITRIFTATDDGGRTATCSQVITVYDANPFTINDLDFPGDTVLHNGCMSETDPDNTGWPILSNEDQCNEIAMTYEDLVFSQVDGACLKILREWRVIDWCQFDRTAPDECYPANAGRWCHTQVIKVHDLEGPEFTSDCNDKQFCIEGNDCSERITLSATAFDACTPSDQLIWSFEIFIDNDNVADIAGNRSSYTDSFEAGTYTIVWTVEDQCGNATTCEYDFEVEDCKKPTPYCEVGITTVIMPSTGTITLWASDFNAGSFDNCTDTSDLTYSFSNDINDTNREFTCADIENGISDTFSINMYVWDEAGNHDLCVTMLILQDNQDVCPDKGNLTGMIAGLVSTQNSESMKDVEVVLQSPSMTTNKMFMTDDDGHYEFADLTMYENYSVKPQLNADPMNGISTKDLVLIQRHLLGYETFDSPYKYIAADVNNTQSVSAGDISELRKLILGLHATFPKNESWRFVNENFTFVDPADPFPFEEEISIHDFSKDEMASDFVAIKVGDVSGDADPSGFGSIQTRSSLTLNEMETVFGSNGEILIPITMSDASEETWYGFQFTGAYDADNFEFEELRSAALEISTDNVADMGAGMFTFSWHSVEAKEITNGEILFYAVLRAKSTANNKADFVINSSITQALAIGGDLVTYELKTHKVSSEAGFALYQNTPNPFRATTNIGFELPRPMEYSIEVYDMSGKILKRVSGIGQKGYQSMELDMTSFNESSVLYYQLKTENYSSTKKMVIIE